MTVAPPDPDGTVLYRQYPHQYLYPSPSLYPGRWAELIGAEYRPGHLASARYERAKWGRQAPHVAGDLGTTFYRIASNDTGESLPVERTFAVQPGRQYTLELSAGAGDSPATATGQAVFALEGAQRSADGPGEVVRWTFTPDTDKVTLRAVSKTGRDVYVFQLRLTTEADLYPPPYFTQLELRVRHTNNQTYDQLPFARRIRVVRGYRTDGAVASASVGTLTVEFVNRVREDEPMLLPGHSIRFRNWLTGDWLFFGWIADVDHDYVLDKLTGEVTTITTVTAEDAVSQIANYTRHGAVGSGDSGEETFTQRINRLMGSIPELPYTIEDPADNIMGATVWETSLANHLDATCNSANRRWHVAADGDVIFRRNRPAVPQMAYLSDALTDPRTDAARYTLPYTDLTLSHSTRDVINEVVFENHRRHADGSAYDQNLGPFRDAASIAQNGRRSAKVPSTLHYTADTGNPGSARDLAETHIFPQFATARLKPQQVQFEATADLAAASQIDINSTVAVHRLGTTYNCLVAGIDHELTPFRWRSKLTLTRQVEA